MVKLNILFFLATFSVSILNAQTDGAAIKIGDLAPDFETTTVDGKHIRLSDFRGNYLFGGKYVLLNFWGTWCGGCRAELLDLKDARYFFDANDFEMISVAFEPESRDIKAFADSMGMNWKQIVEIGFGQKEKSITNLYHINAWPSNFLIGKEGTIIAANLWGHAVFTEVNKYLKPAKSFDAYSADSSRVLLSLMKNDAHDVSVAGTFSEWVLLPMYHVNDRWIRRLALPPGTYDYKFAVDGKWILDPSNTVTADDGKGKINSRLQIKH